MTRLSWRLLESAGGATAITTATASGSDQYSYNTSDDDHQFDDHMVLILAVLLCALLFAIALNLFARCVIPYINTRRPRPSATAGGLKKRALRQLPMAVVYGSSLGPDQIECSICLGEFVEGERVRVLPICCHNFHVGCIDTWLVSHASCPNCRLSLLPQTSHNAQ